MIDSAPPGPVGTGGQAGGEAAVQQARTDRKNSVRFLEEDCGHDGDIPPRWAVLMGSLSLSGV